MRLENLPNGKKLGWDFTSFNGEATITDKEGNRVSGKIISIDDVRYAELSSKHGKLTIGYNGYYGQWAFEEAGGAVLVPYSVSPDNELYLAGGYEKRLLIEDGQALFTPPGGFGLNKELSSDTAIRETLEETGIHLNDVVEVGHFTSNRAFWIKEKDGNWPVTVFACKVDWETLSFKDGQYFIPATENAIPELDKLSKLIFLPALDAVDNSCDGIAIAAYAKTITAKLNNLI